MSFVVATARNKRKGDLAASFPLIGRCLKCFKHLLIDPDSLCATAPGKKNCDRCNKGSDPCELIPRNLSEACRAWEDTVMVFKAWLEAHPNQRAANTEQLADWTFEEWMLANKLTDSSRRLAKPEDDSTWTHVPIEYKNVYLQGVNLITKISNEIKQQSTTGASSAENATIGAIHELTSEIRAFREVYMAVHQCFPAEDERIPESVSRWFTKS